LRPLEPAESFQAVLPVRLLEGLRQPQAWHRHQPPAAGTTSFDTHDSSAYPCRALLQRSLAASDAVVALLPDRRRLLRAADRRWTREPTGPRRCVRNASRRLRAWLPGGYP